MKKFKKFAIKSFLSNGYTLTPIELKDEIPFEVKRVYYMTKFKSGSNTGEHCHYVEEEVFVQLHGTSSLVTDRGQGKEEIPLAEGDAVYLPNYFWHGFKNASADCVILALSSTNYNETREDYLENYDQYLEIRDKHL